MIVTFEHLNKIRMSFFNKTIVLCHGCFDIFHIGHLNYLMKSKKIGDILVVSVTNDEFVRKGNNRPIFNIHDRLSIINSLNMVNYCVISDDFLCVDIIKKLKPDILTKGIDVKGEEKKFGSNLYLENNELLKLDSILYFVNSNVDISSSKIINNYD